MRINSRTGAIVRELPVPKPRRPRKRKGADAEQLQRDFWIHFDLEKFATDWRREGARRIA